MKKKISRELFWCLSSIICTLIFLWFIYDGWCRDWLVPITYNNDGLGAVAIFKKIQMGQGLGYFEQFKAPFEEQVYTQDFFFSYILAKFIMIFTDEIGLATNLFWISTYVLTCITTYIFMRKLGCSYPVVLMSVLIYNFLPYHYFRIEHFWLMGCYFIPLVGCLVIDIFKNNMGKKQYFFWTIECLLIGLNGIYYSFFSIIVIAIATFICVINEKKLKTILPCIFDIAFIVLPIILLIFLPMKMAGSSNHLVLSADRPLGQIDYYGMKLLLMLLPIVGHRIPALDEFTRQIYKEIGLNNETYAISLGLIMAIGLAISIIYTIKKEKNDWESMVSFFGFINIVIIIFASAGGIANFVGIFVTTLVRCYNRMVVFVALFSVASVGMIIDNIKYKRNICKVFLCVLLSFIGVLDQTSSYFASYELYDISEEQFVYSNDENAANFYSDKAFFEQINNYLDNEKMVYVEPIIPQKALSESSLQRIKLYLYNISSTFCSVEDTDYVNWYNELERESIEVKIKALSILGYSGVILDKSVFETENAYNNALREYKEVSDCIIEYNDIIFCGFKEKKADIINLYSSDELKEIRNQVYLVMHDDSVSVPDELLINVNENKVSCGETQYGPYIDLDKGVYKIAINGENLLQSKVMVTSSCGQNEIEISDLNISDNWIEYTISLDKNEKDVEFKLCNENNDAVIYDYYYMREKEYSIHDIWEYKNHLKELFGIGKYTIDMNFYELFANENVKMTGKSISIAEDGVVYGPYWDNTKSAKYIVSLSGECLSNLDINVTSGYGEKSYGIDYIVNDNSKITFEVNVPQNVSALEFVFKNKGKDITYIYDYTVEKNEIW